MLKVKTLGMINDNKKSFPDKNAHADIINGYFCNINDTETVPLTSATAQEPDIYVVMNTINGDESYTDADIKAGEKANCFLVKEWDRQFLQLNDKHITTPYASINVGDILVADTNGKLVVGAAAGYSVIFRVVKKMQFAGNGLEVQILVA